MKVPRKLEPVNIWTERIDDATIAACAELRRIATASSRQATFKKMLAQLLTGNEIIAEVCRELRARQPVGGGSDPPVACGH